MALPLGLFAVLVAHSWLAWGDVDADYGREMYVPLRLLEHDVLYRDVRYPYGPFSPYLHMLGYWSWRPHLNVLYADGIVSSALLLFVLYDIARALGGSATAMVAVMLIMLDVAFVPGSKATFSFIFPYAYPALHGLLFVSACIAAAFRLLSGRTRAAALVSGSCAGLALLTKVEFGVVALVVVAVTSAGLILRDRHQVRTPLLLLWLATLLWPVLGYGLLAMAMPPDVIVSRGLFAPEYFTGSRVIAWHIAGLLPDATWQQNGERLVKHWGASVPLYACGLGAIALAGALGHVCRTRVRPWIVGLLIAACVWIAWWVSFPPSWYTPLVGVVRGRYALLPVLLTGVTVASSSVLVVQIARGNRVSLAALRYCILSVVALALLVRVPASLVPGGYANFLLPLGIVLLVHLLMDRLPALPFGCAASHDAMRGSAAGLLIGLAIFVGLCNWQWWDRRTLDVVTERGILRLQEEPASLAFRQALEWIGAQASPGATLLAIPRGPALSFLSGHGNALYETSLVVSVANAAQERAYIAALEQTPPDLVVTSTIAQPEYGLGPWGTDNHREILRWIEQAYAVTATANVRGYGVITLWTRKSTDPGIG